MAISDVIATILGSEARPALKPDPAASIFVTESAPRLTGSPLHRNESIVTIQCYGATEVQAYELAIKIIQQRWPHTHGLISVRPQFGPAFAARPLGGRIQSWRYDVTLSVVWEQ